MSEMIERVARASFAAWRQRMIETGQCPEAIASTFEDLNESEREFAFIHARAAIAAMREPNGIMATAGGDTAFRERRMIYGIPSIDTCAVYRAMIDAALAEKRA